MSMDNFKKPEGYKNINSSSFRFFQDNKETWISYLRSFF